MEAAALGGGAGAGVRGAAATDDQLSAFSAPPAAERNTSEHLIRRRR